MSKISTKTINLEYKIILLFNENGEKIESIIEKAFLKYLKYNDYKYDNAK